MENDIDAADIKIKPATGHISEGDLKFLYWDTGWILFKYINEKWEEIDRIEL